MEYEILLMLAQKYRNIGDVINALRTYKYIQSAFNNKISNFHITSEMAKIFNDIFLPGGIADKIDDFTLVALFYEFKELNPIGAAGDEVIISIAKRLVRLDLLENASDLLIHQVNYRLQGVQKLKNADFLAIILIMNNKPLEAIKILEETDIDNFDFQEHQYRVRLRAKALMQMKEYQKALDYLSEDDSIDAKIIKKEIFFQIESWESLIKIINMNYQNLIKQVSTDQNAEQDILRLAIAYYKMDKKNKLSEIIIDLKNSNTAIKVIIDLMLTSSGEVNYRNLEKSLKINQITNLLNKYKNQFLKKEQK